MVQFEQLRLKKFNPLDTKGEGVSKPPPNPTPKVFLHNFDSRKL